MTKEKVKSYDVAVIGSGPGGYAAAVRCAQLGMKVICIDKSELRGGTCTSGCISSKALLHSSKMYYEAKEKFHGLGVDLENIKMSISKMHENKNNIMHDISSDIDELLSSNKVEFLQGEATFIARSKKDIRVKSNQAGEVRISPRNTIIATGSSNIQSPTIEIDEKFILSSDGALNMQYLPKKMVIVGCGVIGLEVGSIWSRLGTEVIFLERGSRIMGRSDLDVGSEAEEIFSAQNMKFMKNAAIDNIIKKEMVNGIPEVQLSFSNSETGKIDEIDSINAVMFSIGRKANFASLQIENCSIKSRGGFIEVDEDFKTSADGIYAIGDVIGGQMLAHKASEEGVAVAEIIAGQKRKLNYSSVPSVIYTSPEIAFLGESEASLIAKGKEYKVGKCRLISNHRAKIKHKEAGFIKILSSKEGDEILGAAIIGENAGDIIQSIAMAMSLGASPKDLAFATSPRPTIGESVKEAAAQLIHKTTSST